MDRSDVLRRLGWSEEMIAVVDAAASRDSLPMIETVDSTIEIVDVGVGATSLNVSEESAAVVSAAVPPPRR